MHIYIYVLKWNNRLQILATSMYEKGTGVDDYPWTRNNLIFRSTWRAAFIVSGLSLVPVFCFRSFFVLLVTSYVHCSSKWQSLQISRTLFSCYHCLTDIYTLWIGIRDWTWLYRHNYTMYNMHGADNAIPSMDYLVSLTCCLT